MELTRKKVCFTTSRPPGGFFINIVKQRDRESEKSGRERVGALHCWHRRHDAEQSPSQKAVRKKDYERELKRNKPAIKAAMDATLGAQLGFMFGGEDKFFRQARGRVVNRINQTSKRNLTKRPKRRPNNQNAQRCLLLC